MEQGPRTESGKTAKRPNFFVVGSPKCATAALTYFLGQHPDIFMPDRREPNYFSSDLAHSDAATPDEYAALFAGRSETLLGESSTWYLYSRVAAERIAAECGRDTRIIVVVRDPVRLLLSLFDYRRFFASHRWTALAPALEAETAHLAAVDAGTVRADPLKIHRAVGRSSDGILRYHALFGKDRVRIVFHEDIVNDLPGVMRDLYWFLGVSDSVPVTDRRVNQSFGRRSYWLTRMLHRRAGLRSALAAIIPRGPRRTLLRTIDRLNTRPAEQTRITPELRAELEAYYADDVRMLSTLTGRNLSHWVGDAAGSGEMPVRVAPPNVLQHQTAL